MRELSLVSLPAELTSLVGRRTEIAAITDLATDQRLVTLVALGTVGKTRLVAQVATPLVDRCEDGVWFTDLSLTGDPELVPALVAEPFEVGDVGTAKPRPLTQVLAEYFSDQPGPSPAAEL